MTDTNATIATTAADLWTVLKSKGSWSGDYTARNLSGADPKSYELLSCWLFAACGGSGEAARAPHYIKGSTFRDFLCGLYDRGVMIFIDQRRDIRLALAPSPEAKIKHWGNQDSRFHGSMWPTLDGCKEGSAGWLSLRDLPESAHEAVRQTLTDLLQEGYEAAEQNRLAREKTKQRSIEENENKRAQIAAAWGDTHEQR